jgi:hypothetical protein
MTTYEFLLSKHGVRVTIPEISAILKIPVNTIICNRSKGKFNLNLYRDGRSLFCNTADLAEWIDNKAGR